MAAADAFSPGAWAIPVAVGGTKPHLARHFSSGKAQARAGAGAGAGHVDTGEQQLLFYFSRRRLEA